MFCCLYTFLATVHLLNKVNILHHSPKTSYKCTSMANMLNEPVTKETVAGEHPHVIDWQHAHRCKVEKDKYRASMFWKPFLSIVLKRSMSQECAVTFGEYVNVSSYRRAKLFLSFHAWGTSSVFCFLCSLLISQKGKLIKTWVQNNRRKKKYSLLGN